MYVHTYVRIHICANVSTSPFLLLPRYSAWEGVVPVTTNTRFNRRSSALTQSRPLRRAARSPLGSLGSSHTIPSHLGRWRPSRGTHRQGWVRIRECCVREVGRWECTYMLGEDTHVRTYTHTYMPLCTSYVHVVCVSTYYLHSHLVPLPTPPHSSPSLPHPLSSCTQPPEA